MVSNEKINKLGESIFIRNGKIESNELELLQEFRTSFSKPLVDTFNEVREIADKVHGSAIVAFRLKRIGTILNKIQRQPKMKLSRMGDIAGIRCIFYNETEVYKALELIKNRFELSGRIRDYLVDKQPLGYKSVHVYVKDLNTKKSIEIQLRTIHHHNWSTLVEITDLLYDLRLKEIGSASDPEFAFFHELMSSDKSLSKKEADLIYNVLEKRNFIGKLSSTFRKNNNEVKKRWSSEDKGNSFFLIEASKNEIPTLRSFKTFEEAEKTYFLKYKENDAAEIVLTSIRKPNFKQISIAYANYILSYHTFIKDIQPILQELAREALEDKRILKFRKVFKTYEDLQANLLLDVLMESADLFLNKLERNKVILGRTEKMTKLQEREIRKKVDRRIREHNKSHRDFIDDLELYIPKDIIRRKYITGFLKKHNNRIRKIMMKNRIEFDNLLRESSGGVIGQKKL